ncbi:MAG: AraC family transcriptional regulator [Rhodospirillales bacterium]|nr:AraC family transcriptional regulator [Rhodospirillales bacterium]
MPTSSAPRDAIELARDHTSGVETIRARFSGHAYDLHRHDEWLVGVTDRGVQDFFCRGARRRSTPGRVILLEPQEAHDGHAGAEGGFAYRMLYLPQAWLRQALPEGGTIAGFRESLTDDPRLAGAIRNAWGAIAASAPRLARDLTQSAVAARLARHSGQPTRPAGGGRDLGVARRARDCLHDTWTEEIGADALARAAGAADRFQLARAFRAAYGTAPHAYLVQLRLVRARALLTEGEGPAAVAAACGFADQSHLGRWFRRAYGITPGAYRACCTGVPDHGPGSR